jgi:ATP-dependent RNA helicase DeaD
MKQSQRDIVMKKFRTGKTNILIATDVAARGIDVDDIEVVFNYDIPTDEEYYVHRIGRTGRAGKEGKAITFVSSKEMYKLKQIEKYTNTKMQEYDVPTAKFLNEKKLNKVLDKITKEIDASDLTEEISIIEKYLENTEINVIDVAAVLLKLKLGKSKLEEVEIKDEVYDTGRVDRVRLFLTIGKMDNLRRGDLKDFVAKEANIARSEIFDTEVLDKFSFVTTTIEAADQIIKKLNDTTYNDRRLAIEISTGKGSSKSSSGRSSSSRGGNFERRGNSDRRSGSDRKGGSDRRGGFSAGSRRR